MCSLDSTLIFSNVSSSVPAIIWVQVGHLSLFCAGLGMLLLYVVSDVELSQSQESWTLDRMSLQLPLL